MADDIKNDSVVTEDTAEEVIEAAEDIVEAPVEETVVETVEEAAEETVEEVAAEPAEEIAAASAEEVASAVEDVKEEIAEEPAPAKELTKAEAAGAAAAAAAAEAAARKAEKARIAKEKASVKSAKKVEKKKAKLEQELKLKDECPIEYKPVSTAKYFWIGVASLCFQPLSFIITLLFCMIPRNRNIKHFAQALFVYQIICIILAAIAIAIFYLALDPSTRDQLISSGGKILSSFSIGF